jgi:phage shock protein C
MKKIHKSEESRIISGVFGGLGEHYDIDPNLLRLLGILVCILSGIVPFVIAYIVACVIIPEKKEKTNQIPIYRKWWFWVVSSLLLLYFLFMFMMYMAKLFYSN